MKRDRIDIDDGSFRLLYHVLFLASYVNVEYAYRLYAYPCNQIRKSFQKIKKYSFRERECMAVRILFPMSTDQMIR